MHLLQAGWISVILCSQVFPEITAAARLLTKTKRRELITNP